MANYRISIPQPCSQNWDQMVPENNGRYCDTCQKVVVDFTGKTKEEILEIILKNKSVCGRIPAKQLNTPFKKFKPVRYTKYHWPSVTAFIIAGMFSVASGYSQTPRSQKLYPRSIATEKYIPEYTRDNGNEVTETATAIKILQQTPAHFILRGKVHFDSPSYWQLVGDSLEQKPPAVDAKIQIWKGSRKITEIQSDEKGEFVVRIDNKYLNKWLDFTIIHQEAEDKIEYHKLDSSMVKDTLVIELDRHEVTMGAMVITRDRNWSSGAGNTYYDRDLLMLFPGY